jgi:hypothetical protein
MGKYFGFCSREFGACPCDIEDTLDTPIAVQRLIATFAEARMITPTQASVFIRTSSSSVFLDVLLEGPGVEGTLYRKVTVEWVDDTHMKRMVELCGREIVRVERRNGVPQEGIALFRFTVAGTVDETTQLIDNSKGLRIKAPNWRDPIFVPKSEIRTVVDAYLAQLPVGRHAQVKFASFGSLIRDAFVFSLFLASSSEDVDPKTWMERDAKRVEVRLILSMLEKLALRWHDGADEARKTIWEGRAKMLNAFAGPVLGLAELPSKKERDAKLREMLLAEVDRASLAQCYEAWHAATDKSREQDSEGNHVEAFGSALPMLFLIQEVLSSPDCEIPKGSFWVLLTIAGVGVTAGLLAYVAICMAPFLTAGGAAATSSSLAATITGAITPLLQAVGVSIEAGQAALTFSSAMSALGSGVNGIGLGVVAVFGVGGGATYAISLSGTPDEVANEWDKRMLQLEEETDGRYAKGLATFKKQALLAPGGQSSLFSFGQEDIVVHRLESAFSWTSSEMTRAGVAKIVEALCRSGRWKDVADLFDAEAKLTLDNLESSLKNAVDFPEEKAHYAVTGIAAALCLRMREILATDFSIAVRGETGSGKSQTLESAWQLPTNPGMDHTMQVSWYPMTDSISVLDFPGVDEGDKARLIGRMDRSVSCSLIVSSCRRGGCSPAMQRIMRNAEGSKQPSLVLLSQADRYYEQNPSEDELFKRLAWVKVAFLKQHFGSNEKGEAKAPPPFIVVWLANLLPNASVRIVKGGQNVSLRVHNIVDVREWVAEQVQNNDLHGETVRTFRSSARRSGHTMECPPLGNLGCL